MNAMDVTQLSATLDRLHSTSSTALANAQSLVNQLSGDVEHVLSLDAGRVEESSDTDFSLILDELQRAAEQLADLPTSLRQSGNDFQLAVAELQDAIAEFVDLAELYDAAHDEVTDFAESCGIDITEVAATAQDEMIEAVAEMEDEVSEALEGNIREPGGALAEHSTELLEDAANAIAERSQSILTVARAASEGAFERVKNEVGATAEHAVATELRLLGEEIIDSTLDQVTGDMELTFISAQISTALSSQLPNLIVAKKLTGAVKRALELLRSGRL